MESHKLNKLVESFWQGQLSEAERAELDQVLRQSPAHQELEAIRQYLQFWGDQRVDSPLGADFDQQLMAQIQAKRPVAQVRRFRWARLAAAIALIGGLSWGVQQLAVSDPAPPKEIAQNYTPAETQRAFQEVKKALYLLSSNMNQGVQHSRILTEFHQAQEAINRSSKQEQKNEDSH